MKTTLDTIARNTGFSKSTISRVLNNKAYSSRISRKTAEIILAEAERCGYTPNLIAQNLRTGKTSTIGLLVPSLANPYFAEIASVIVQEAMRYGYITITADTMENVENQNSAVTALLTRQVDGIITVPCGSDPAYLEQTNEQCVPVILIDRYYENSPLPYVVTNNFRGGYMAASLLVRNGHENIACVQGPAAATTSRKRIEGCISALAENGLEDNIYTISLTVRNTGSVPGKEVVQVYLQKPYTGYDEDNGIEKASVELVGFAKTGLLDANGGANDSETVEIVVEESSLTSYDAKGAKTYILEAGDYYFTAARDAHDAVNNILKAKDASAETVAQGNTTAGNADFVEVVSKENTDTETYSVSTKGMEAGLTDSETKITNQFEKVDITYYQGATSNFRYMTRSDWEGTVSFAVDQNGVRTQDQVDVTVTDEMSSAYDGYLSDPAGDGSEYPVYGVNNDPEAEGHLNLIDLRAYDDEDDDPTNNEWIPYDHELWDTLLNQLTWQETVDLLSHGYRMTYGIASIAKPQTIDHNGACGPIQPYGSGANNNGFAKIYYQHISYFCQPATPIAYNFTIIHLLP